MPKGMLPRETLRQLQDVPDSAVIKVTQNMHMAIHPQYLGNIQLGIINYFNSEITHFNSKLDGVLLGYGKIRLKEPKAEVLNEEHYLHLDVHSDFWVFRPQIDSILAGVVNTKSSAHVSVLIHGLFNVPCHKNLGLEKDEWIGTGVQVGEHVRVRIVRMDLNQKIPFLMGELLETTPKVNVKEEPMELILVENIKEEKVWEDITAGNEDSDMDNGEEEELASTEKKKKKKKSKIDYPEDDELTVSESLVYTEGKKENTLEGEITSPIISRMNNWEEEERVSMGEKKKKKSKKKSPEEEESVVPELSSSLVYSEREIENTVKREITSPILSQITDEQELNDKKTEGEGLSNELKERLCSSLLVPKKKKKKKKNRSLSPSDENVQLKNSDETREKLSASLLECLTKVKVKKEKKSKRSISPDSFEDEYISDEKKAKKKKKSKRSISPEAIEEEKYISHEKKAKKKKNKSKQRSISPEALKEAKEYNHLVDEKEELSNSLISNMLSNVKKKERRSKSLVRDNESKNVEDKDNDDKKVKLHPSDDSPNDAENRGQETPFSFEHVSKVLFPEKKVKKKKSLYEEQLAIIRQTVEENIAQDSKRKRSSSESSSLESSSAKKPRLESQPSATSTASPSCLRFQEPKLPEGWYYVLAPNTPNNKKKKKGWFSPSGVKYNTLKAAQESINNS